MYVVIHKDGYGDLSIKLAPNKEDTKKCIVDAIVMVDEDIDEWPVEILELKDRLELGDFGPRSFLILDVNKVVQPEIKVHMEVTMDWDKNGED